MGQYIVDFLSLGFYILGGLLIVSAIGKIRNFGTFEVAVDRYDPRFPVMAVASIWLMGEFIAGAFLLSPWSLRFVPATIVLGLGAGAMLRRLIQGQQHGCGCSSRNHPISARTLARNALLLAWVSAGSIWFSGLPVVLVAIPLAVLVGFGSVGGHSRNARPVVPTRHRQLIPSK